MNTSMTFTALVLLALLPSACFFTHDYSTCASDSDCPYTHQCREGLCRPRSGHSPCDPGVTPAACPQGMFCHPTLAVCLPEATDTGTDLARDRDAPVDGNGGSQDASGDGLDDAHDPDGMDGDPTTDGPGDPACSNDDQCSNQRFCDGQETCQLGVCVPGEPPLSDGWSCTNDSCDEDGDRTVHEPRDFSCRDDNPCSVDLCAPTYQNTNDGTGCFHGPIGNGTICAAGKVCRELSCVEAGCGNAVVEPADDESCDDGNRLSMDGCDENCHWEQRRLDLSSGMSSPDRVIRGVDPQDHWGSGFVCADVNGDRVDDLVLWTRDAGGPENTRGDHTPEIRVVHGPLPDGPSHELADLSDWLLYSPQDESGLSVITADLDVDGIQDLIVSTPDYDDGSIQQAGAVWIYLGTTDPTHVHHDQDLSASQADISFFGRLEGTRLEAMGLADVDGSGTPDLVFRMTDAGHQAIIVHFDPIPGRYQLPGELGAASILPEPLLGSDLGSGGMAVFPGGVGQTPLLAMGDALARRLDAESFGVGRAYGLPLPAAVESGTPVLDVASTTLVGGSLATEMWVEQLADLTGDGFPELTLLKGGPNGNTYYLYLVSTAGWENQLIFLDFSASGGVGIWEVFSDSLSSPATRLVDMTADGQPDLAVLTGGLFLDRGSDPPPGIITVIPSPTLLGASVNLFTYGAPLQIRGGEGDDLRTMDQCDRDPLGHQQLVLGLAGAGPEGAEGLLWVYDTVPWAPVSN